ncbi:MAG: hypothetical protein ACRDG6_04420 [Candidatus Limnocylindria bacterium]
MDDIRDQLAHVLWIGGAPNAGKTTLARLLAGKYDLKIYNADWHHVREHRGHQGGVPTRWNEQSMDERWVEPSPGEMADRDVANWTARFRLVVEDIRALPDVRPIVAEGPSLFPWCVRPLLRSAQQAIFLLPTPEYRVRVLARRNRDTPAGQRTDGMTSDPERARRNIAARDALLKERIAASCDELGLRWVRIDGSLDLDDSVALLEEHFGPYLPSQPNV